MCQIKPRLTKNQFHKNKYCLCRRMTRHTQIPDTYELFLDFLKTSINNQNKICLSDSQIVYTQIVKAIISIWNHILVILILLQYYSYIIKKTVVKPCPTPRNSPPGSQKVTIAPKISKNKILEFQLLLIGRRSRVGFSAGPQQGLWWLFYCTHQLE